MSGGPSLYQNISDFLVRHRKTAAISIFISIPLFFFLFAGRIHFENSIESFISTKDPDKKYYQEFKKEFGDDQVIVLVIPTGEIFTRENLEKIDRLSESLKEIPGIAKVRSITTAQDIVGSEDGFEVRPFLEKIPEDAQALERLRQAALMNPLYRYDFFSKDAQVASLLIEAKVSSDEDRYKNIRNGIFDVLKKSDFKDSPYYLAGEALVELQLTEDMWRDLGVFVPATYLCLAILLYFLFRDGRTVFIQLLVITLCLGFLAGLMGLLKMSMNAVTVSLPSLTLCIAVMDVIHILNAYRSRLREMPDSSKAMKAAMQESFEPCFLTSVTTMIGFASMSVSDLIPIRQFGILGAIATGIAFPISVMTLPYLMGFISPKKFAEKAEQDHQTYGIFFTALQKWHKRKMLMSVVILGIVGVCIAGLFKVKVETNNMKFLKETTLVRRSTDYIEKNLAGTTMLEVAIETPSEDGVKDPRVLKQIDSFQKFLEQQPQIDKSISPVQFIKEMNQAMNEEDPAFYTIPESEEQVAQYILTYSFSGRGNDLDDFVDYNYRIARVRGRMKQLSTLELTQVLQKIKAFAKENFDPDLKVRVTSYALLQANMSKDLVDGQIQGLGLEFLLLMIVFSWVHKSLVVGIFSLIPNVIPLLACFGMMGWSGVPLNVGTAMTVCIAFGLVVDDTIHFFHHAREVFRKSKSEAGAFDKIFSVIGPPVLFSSFLLAGGFGILMLGQSYATSIFGALCTFTILFALLCELFITPFLLKYIPALQEALRKH